MRIKSKLAGVVAAAILTFSMAGGASAQNGQAVLAEGQCTAGSVFSTGFQSFGTWKYNGTSRYVLQGTVGVDNVGVFKTKVATVPSPTEGCNVVINTDGISNGTDTIGSNYFFLTTGGLLRPMPATMKNQGLGEHSYNLQLVSVPTDVSTGTYSGTITVTVQNAD